MGTTITTLHLIGAEKYALEQFIGGNFILREINTPWISIVPVNDGARLDPIVLERIAKRVTKTDFAITALLFQLFDDDMFFCSLFKNGKAAARIKNNESWLKLGKQLDSLFKTDSYSKAFRLAPNCAELTECLALMEETLGLALMDFGSEKPRRVEKSDETLKKVKARASELRKRPNQYKLTALSFEEWPETLRSQYELFERLRHDWSGFHAVSLLYGMTQTHERFTVPFKPEIAVFPFTDFGNDGHLIVYDRIAKTVKDVCLHKENAVRSVLNVAWITRNGEFVCIIAESEIDYSERVKGQIQYIACIDEFGEEKWRFIPDNGCKSASYPRFLNASPEGVLSFYANGIGGTYTELYKLHGETGIVLLKKSIPSSDCFDGLGRVDAINGYIYYSAASSEFVLLDNDFECIERSEGTKEITRLSLIADHVSGTLVWSQHMFGDRNKVFIFDINNKTKKTVNLEIPSMITSVLEDGRILGLTGRTFKLVVYDSEGKVAARCPIGGTVRLNGSDVLLFQNCDESTGGFFSDEIIKAASVCVWRLDNV